MDRFKRPQQESPNYRERIRNRSKSPDRQRCAARSSDVSKESKIKKTSETRWDDPINKFSEDYKPEKPPKHRAPPNRFNILPGKQWDGIDRSNGFEKAYFKKLAQQNIKKDLDYKYTVADM